MPASAYEKKDFLGSNAGRLDPPSECHFQSPPGEIGLSGTFEAPAGGLEAAFQKLIDQGHFQVESVGIFETVRGVVLHRSAGLSPQVSQKIKELSQLQEHWDGRNAQPIKMDALADATEVLIRLAQRSDYREPFLAPAFDGFLQIEWHDQKRSFEIEAVTQGWSLVGTLTGTDGRRQYFVADCGRAAFKELEEFYSWFLGKELLWPSK